MKKAAVITVSLFLCLTLLGCGVSKETTDLQKSMLGHWQNGSGGEVFLSPTTMTLVYKNEKYVITYRATSANQGSSFKILNTKINVEQAKKIKSEYIGYTGSSDSDQMTLDNGLFNPGNFLFNPMDFKFVDSKQNP